MRKVIEVAKLNKLPVHVNGGDCLITLPCSEWIRLNMISGYSLLHLTVSTGVDELLTKTYDLQPTKAGYYLIDEDTVSTFVSILPDRIVTSEVSKCKERLADFASCLRTMESSEQRSECVRRIGQDKLRQLLLASIGECEISGIQNKDLLVVSHIKPWEDCIDGGTERLDLENVLLLAANWDALFDKKYISFDPETGKMIKSDRIDEKELRKFGVPVGWRDCAGIQIKTEYRKNYLHWHNRLMMEADAKKQKTQNKSR